MLEMVRRIYNAKGERGMELLLEFLFVVPEIFLDMLCICGFTANPRKARSFPEDEPKGIYLIATRMADMTPEGRKRMIRFNNISFLLIAAGTFVIGIGTIMLMYAVSGWFWILGVIIEIIMAAWAYRCWKKKAMAMTAKA